MMELKAWEKCCFFSAKYWPETRESPAEYDEHCRLTESCPKEIGEITYKIAENKWLKNPELETPFYSDKFPCVATWPWEMEQWLGYLSCPIFRLWNKWLEKNEARYPEVPADGAYGIIDIPF